MKKIISLVLFVLLLQISVFAKLRFEVEKGSAKDIQSTEKIFFVSATYVKNLKVGKMTETEYIAKRTAKKPEEENEGSSEKFSGELRRQCLQKCHFRAAEA